MKKLRHSYFIELHSQVKVYGCHKIICVAKFPVSPDNVYFCTQSL